VPPHVINSLPVGELFWYPDTQPRRMTFVNGSDCPDCGTVVETTNGTEYECPECGRAFDHADLFYP